MIGRPDETAIRVEGPGVPSLVRRLKVGAWHRVASELRHRRALAELSRLDDRDLGDLSLGRGHLPWLAHQHARTAP